MITQFTTEYSIVDLDLEKFFDTVSHSRFIGLLSNRIKDGRAVSLIHKYLMSGLQAGMRLEETHSGVPLGSPLSPLLSNIMLNELDKEPDRRGHSFVRYADNCMIFCKSLRAAERTSRSIIRYIEDILYLRVNEEKTSVGRSNGMGYGRRKTVPGRFITGWIRANASYYNIF